MPLRPPKTEEINLLNMLFCSIFFYKISHEWLCSNNTTFTAHPVSVTLISMFYCRYAWKKIVESVGILLCLNVSCSHIVCHISLKISTFEDDPCTNIHR